MQVVLITASPDPEYAIGLMAAECYDSKVDRESCIKRASHCVSSSHLATLRFAYATFHVNGISRVCSHQIVRMAHAGILQRSQRYVKETSVEYIEPPALAKMHAHLQTAWWQIQSNAEALYLQLIEEGMKKEDARYILPQGCSTSMNLCLNFHAWKDFLAARTSKHAQWEVREVALAIQRELSRLAPNTFPLE